MSRALIYVRTYLTRILVIVGALSIIFTWYLTPAIPVAVIATEMTDWNLNIAGFALFVGLLSVFSGYSISIRKRARFWQYYVYSIVLILVFIAWGIPTGVYTATYQHIFTTVRGDLSIAMLGTLGFFIMSGAYRAFRIRTLRTAIFAVSCATVGVMNIGYVLTTFPTIYDVVFWLLSNPAAGGARAILMTNGLGSIVLGIRIILGAEKGALRMTQEVA